MCIICSTLLFLSLFSVSKRNKRHRKKENSNIYLLSSYLIDFYYLECEMRSLLLDELNNVVGEGLLDPLFPHLISGPTYVKVTMIFIRGFLNPFPPPYFRAYLCQGKNDIIKAILTFLFSQLIQEHPMPKVCYYLCQIDFLDL